MALPKGPISEGLFFEGLPSEGKLHEVQLLEGLANDLLSAGLLSERVVV